MKKFIVMALCASLLSLSIAPSAEAGQKKRIALRTFQVGVVGPVYVVTFAVAIVPAMVSLGLAKTILWAGQEIDSDLNAEAEAEEKK